MTAAARADATYLIGHLSVRLAGSSCSLPIIKRWMEHLPMPVMSGAPDIIISVFDDEVRAADLEESGPTLAAWSVEREPGDASAAFFRASAVHPHRAAQLPTPVYRLMHPGYLSQSEHLASVFMEEVLVGVTQHFGLRRAQTFVPTAAVRRGAEVVMIVGPGGSGKTGSVLQLCTTRGWDYVSDDLAVISDSGLVFTSPNPIEVALRNLSGDGVLTDFVPNAGSPRDRLAWRLHSRLRGRGLRRLVPVSDFPGTGPDLSPCKVTDMLLLDSGERSGPLPVTSEHAAVAVEGLLREDLTHSWAPTGTSNAAAITVSSVLNSAFRSVRCDRLVSPAGTAESVVESQILAWFDTKFPTPERAP